MMFSQDAATYLHMKKITPYYDISPSIEVA
jgi:hypothetical protein